MPDIPAVSGLTNLPATTVAGAVEAIFAETGPLVSPALAPHSIYTVSEGSLRWIAELGAERGLPIQIHLSETEQEVRDCLDEHGMRPAAYLDELGMLNERAVLAHGVWLDRARSASLRHAGPVIRSLAELPALIVKLPPP